MLTYIACFVSLHFHKQKWKDNIFAILNDKCKQWLCWQSLNTQQQLTCSLQFLDHCNIRYRFHWVSHVYSHCYTWSFVSYRDPAHCSNKLDFKIWISVPLHSFQTLLPSKASFFECAAATILKCACRVKHCHSKLGFIEMALKMDHSSLFIFIQTYEVEILQSCLGNVSQAKYIKTVVQIRNVLTNHCWQTSNEYIQTS